MNALIALVLAAAASAPVSASPQAPTEDPVFQALEAEVTRAKTLSLMESPQAASPTSPYHLMAFVGETSTM